MIDIGKITDLENFNPVPVNRYVAKIYCPTSQSPTEIEVRNACRECGVTRKNNYHK